MQRIVGIAVSVSVFVGMLLVPACASSGGDDKIAQALQADGYETTHTAANAKGLLGVYQVLSKEGEPVDERTFALVAPTHSVYGGDEPVSSVMLVVVDADGYQVGILGLGDLTKEVNIKGGLRGLRITESSVKIATRTGSDRSSPPTPQFTLKRVASPIPATLPNDTRAMLMVAREAVNLAVSQMEKRGAWALSINDTFGTRPTSAAAAFSPYLAHFLYRVNNAGYTAFDDFMKLNRFKILQIDRSNFLFKGFGSPETIVRNAVRINVGADKPMLSLYGGMTETDDSMFEKIARNELGK